MVMGTTGIKDTHTATLYEQAFKATRSVSGHCCEVKQQGAWLVAGWVTQALEQGRLGSCAHAGYHHFYNNYRHQSSILAENETLQNGCEQLMSTR